MSPFTLFIILALVIIGIGGLLFWLHTRLKRFFKVKITHWLILIYAFVLLAASVVVPFVSKGLTQLDTQERQDEEEIAGELTEKLESGQTEKIDKKYILAEYRFEGLESQTLTITSHLESSPSIYVDRKDVNDGKVEAVIFQQSFLIDRADFSELLEPYEIQLKENRLTIRSNQQAVNLAIMHSPFPVRQLTNVSMLHHAAPLIEPRGAADLFANSPRFEIGSR